MQSVEGLTLRISSVGTTSALSFVKMLMTLSEGCFSLIAVFSRSSCSSISFLCILAISDSVRASTSGSPGRSLQLSAYANEKLENSSMYSGHANRDPAQDGNCGKWSCLRRRRRCDEADEINIVAASGMASLTSVARRWTWTSADCAYRLLGTQ